MKKLFAIGEALIDFISDETGKSIKDTASFTAKVGGAPLNVCCAFSVLGGESEMITQLGNDPFADKIIDEIKKYNIGCKYIQRTSSANTALAFVSLDEKGNREFSFYRNPSADMLMSAESIKKEWFKDGFALHFCSVSLGNFAMKEAHKKAIDFAAEENMIISFDPNVRFPLWKNKERLKETIHEFITKAHILKISHEEAEFIAGGKDIGGFFSKLLNENIKIIIYTLGEKGARAYTKNNVVHSDGINVKPLDTTGAGDGFIGTFLYKLYENKISADKLSDIPPELIKDMLDFSNKFAAASVMKKGAMPSYCKI